MNRRIRKKLHRGEFNTLGFEVRATFEPPLQDDAFNAFLDEFIAFVEAHNLACGGGVGHVSLVMFITRIKRGRHIGAHRYHWIDEHCVDADRDLVQDWLLDHGAKTTVASPLQGAWS